MKAGTDINPIYLWIDHKIFPLWGQNKCLFYKSRSVSIMLSKWVDPILNHRRSIFYVNVAKYHFIYFFRSSSHYNISHIVTEFSISFPISLKWIYFWTCLIFGGYFFVYLTFEQPVKSEHGIIQGAVSSLTKAFFNP